MGSCMDKILEFLREHPEGATLTEITAMYYPDSAGYELNVKRGSLYGRLNKMERQGLCMRAGTVDVKYGRSTVWKAIE